MHQKIQLKKVYSVGVIQKLYSEYSSLFSEVAKPQHYHRRLEPYINLTNTLTINLLSNVSHQLSTYRTALSEPIYLHIKLVVKAN